jgi:hypothetical protein
MKKKSIVLIAAGLALTFGLSTATADERLEGAWIVATWESLNGETIEEAQPGIYIFTSKNYAPKTRITCSDIQRTVSNTHSSAMVIS